MELQVVDLPTGGKRRTGTQVEFLFDKQIFSKGWDSPCFASLRGHALLVPAANFIFLLCLIIFEMLRRYCLAEMHSGSGLT